jgi:hypothetical protein
LGHLVPFFGSTMKLTSFSPTGWNDDDTTIT